MTDISLKTILEAAIFAAGEPLSVDRLLSLFEQETDKPAKHEIRQALEQLIADYAERPVQLKEIASGYTFQVKEEFSPWVGKLWQEKAPRHSRALLETLAIIAYRQPITRGEIEEIRGVSVSTQIVKTLMDQDWIRVVGQREVPGRPSLYATTPFFLDYFNLKSLSELPSLIELQALQDQQDEEIKEAALGHMAAMAGKQQGIALEEQAPAEEISESETAPLVEDTLEIVETEAESTAQENEETSEPLSLLEEDVIEITPEEKTVNH
jgi:segregation and condensation protein B